MLEPNQSPALLVGSLDVTVNQSPVSIFRDDRLDFLGALSSQLLKQAESRQFPDLASLAFWMRSGNLKRISQSYLNQGPRIGRGLTFHVTPSNVPTNFAYSWAISLISGNSSIVRIPSRDFAQTSIFLEVYQRCASDRGHEAIAESNVFIAYDRDSSLTDRFSQLADIRMIWGGDASVESIRRLRTKAACIDLCFVDRQSLALIHADAINAETKKSIASVANGFVNDAYLFDQAACSSPKLVAWIGGSSEVSRAQEVFWQEVNRIASSRFPTDEATAVRKFADACEGAARGKYSDVFINSNVLYRMTSKDRAFQRGNLDNVLGSFVETTIGSVKDLKQIVNHKTQTITLYGLEPREVAEVAVAESWPGVDRVVPIGSALTMDVIWDGYDLPLVLSRRIGVS